MCETHTACIHTTHTYTPLRTNEGSSLEFVDESAEFNGAKEGMSRELGVFANLVFLVAKLGVHVTRLASSTQIRLSTQACCVAGFDTGG